MAGKWLGKLMGKASHASPDSPSIPTREFHGWVKCHRAEHRNELGDIIMSKTFSFFDVSSEEVTYSELDKAVKQVAEEKGFETLDSPPVRRRRFAGDMRGALLLDRGRYYTLCEDERGSDYGTLANELNSYCDPRRSGFGLANDTKQPNPSQDDHSSSLTIYIANAPGAPSSALHEAQRRGLLPLDKERAAIVIPYTVSELSIQKVLDLRYPETRAWLVKEFSNGKPDWLTYSGRTPPEGFGFYSFLPSLMSRSNGGDDLTDLIGAYLRSNGVEGLIFPSARSDVFVVFNNGQYVRSGGWNLVDYRGAFTDLPKRQLVVLSDWPKFPDTTTRIEAAPPSSEFAGSFRILGNQEHHSLLSHLLLCFRVWDECGYEHLVQGYRWHATRALVHGSQKSVAVTCLQCHNEIPEVPVIFEIPGACPACGSSNITIP